MIALLLLAGCYEPLSNAVFEADQAYLAALPDRAWMGPAQRFLSGEPDASVPAGARDAAVELALYTAAPLDVGALLRNSPPDRRGVSSRTWEAQGLTTGGVAWWVQADAVLEEDGTVWWTASAGDSAAGPFTPVGEGTLEPGVGGETWWDLQVSSELLLDRTFQGELEVSWTIREDGLIRSRLELVDSEAVSLRDTLWEVWDDADGEHDALTYVDRFTVTDDGEVRDGYAVAVENDSGGRSIGAVYIGDTELAFTQCWDEAGALLYQGGDTGISTEGDAEDCLLEAL